MNRKLLALTTLFLVFAPVVVFSAETEQTEQVQQEDLLVQQELYMYLNEQIQQFVFPEKVTIFAQACELLCAELQRAAEQKTELFASVLEKYGQPTEDGKKILQIDLNFSIANLEESGEAKELTEEEEKAFFKTIQDGIASWSIPAEVKTYGQFVTAVAERLQEIANIDATVFAAIMAKYGQKIDDTRTALIITLPLFLHS
jgi:N-methylhydantoinase A/oxoprolinase/acetone carboxylase beta subunit